MKKFYFIIFVLSLIFHSLSFSQNSQGIFNTINESEIVKESQKQYLSNIKSNDSFKKLKLVRLTNLDFLKSDKFSFKLFSDTLYNFSITLNKLDSVSYKISGENNSNSISLVMRNGNITGTLQINNKQYSLIPLGDSIYAIIELDYSKLKPEAPPIIIKGENQIHKSNAVQTGHSVIDLLVVYTPAAEGAVSDIVGLIQNAISTANSSFTGDNIDLEYDLVYVGELSYSEGAKTMDQILYDFRTNSTIQNLRDQYSADLCFLVTNRSDISGNGYLIESPSPYNSYAGYAIANYNRVRDTYTLAHETGHNLGARHDTTEDHGGTYNHGFRYTPGQWCTIMSYYTTETRQNFWSNPNKTYLGVTRGNASYADNARKLNEDRNAVSLFREPQLSGTLSHNQTLIPGRSYTLTGNLIVPSGKTLEIGLATTVSLNGYYIKSTGGTITQQSSSTISGLNAYLKSGSTLKGLFPTVQSAIDNGSSGQTVELLSKTYTGSLSFSSKNNVDLKGLGTSTINNGSISITNSSYVDIYDLKEGGTVTINSSSQSNLSYITFTGSTIVNDYSGTGTDCGFSTALTGGASFAYNSYGGTGDIYYNNIEGFDLGVYLTSNANYNVGTNNEFCSNLLDIGAYSGAYAYAISNTYSTTPSNAVGGNVFLTGQNQVCMNKSNPLAKNSFDQESNPATALSEKYLNILRKISDEKTDKISAVNKHRTEFENLITENKNLLVNTNDSESIRKTISNLYHIYMTLSDKDEFYDFIDNKLSDRKYVNYQPFLKKYLVWDFVNQKRFEEALNLTTNSFEQSTNDDDKAELLYQRGLIYKYYLHSNSAAYSAFNQLANNYKDNLLSKFASNEINSFEGSSFENKLAVSNDQNKVKLENYPNPFNPTTIVSYTLPQKSQVEIRVFDVLGREVAELINEAKERGSYKIEFNGNNLASGIYILTLKAGNIFKSNKMLLIK